MHEGRESVRLGLGGIPSASEDVMVARDLLLAELTGARYHVAHLSTSRSMAMVAFAKTRGLNVSCEVTPHHFALTDQELATYDSNYKMKPPLRRSEDAAAVIEGIVAGIVDAIATDHAPHAGSDKMQEFERCPFGITGLETAIGLALSELVHPGRIAVNRMVELFTTGPANILSLNRGSLAPGAPADVTIFDLDTEWTYDVQQSYSKSRNSPFSGRHFRGGPLATIVGGEIVWETPLNAPFEMHPRRLRAPAGSRCAHRYCWHRHPDSGCAVWRPLGGLAAHQLLLVERARSGQNVA